MMALTSCEVRYVVTPTARVAYRTLGNGPPLLLVHGYPLSGLTWRHMVPRLAERFTCHAVDLPGAGQTEWQPDHDFGFRNQAEVLKQLVETLGLERFGLVAHDTGATIARQLALIAPERVHGLVAIGTEIPGHRPPWIPFFQKAARLPGNAVAFRLAMKSRTFRRSPMGFGGCFHDRALLDGEFHHLFIQPLLDDKTRLQGQIHYLRGIDWDLVDSLAEGHARIQCPVLLVWGQDDPVFPAERARGMVGQLANCTGFVTIADSRLFVHEERPEALSAHVLDHFADLV